MKKSIRLTIMGILGALLAVILLITVAGAQINIPGYKTQAPAEGPPITVSDSPSGHHPPPRYRSQMGAQSTTTYVAITEEGFDPEVITINVGSTVVWTNHLEETVHLVRLYRIYLPLVLHKAGSIATANISSPEKGTQYTSAANDWSDVYLGPGESYSHTFTSADVYYYSLEGRNARGQVNVRQLQEDGPVLMWATGKEGILLRWRYPRKDPHSGRPAPQPLYYNVYRDGTLLNSQPISRITDPGTALTILGDHWQWLQESYELNTIAELHAYLDDNLLAEQWLADQRYPVAIVRGTGYLDDSITPDDPATHTYQVEAVMASGTENVGVVSIRNDGATPLSAPTAVTATTLVSQALRNSADWVTTQQNRNAHGRIALLWNLPDENDPSGEWTAGYEIYRAGPIGPTDDPVNMQYTRINEKPVMPMPAYEPLSPVSGTDVYTIVPYQRHTYYYLDAAPDLQTCQSYAYRIAPRDLLGQAEHLSPYAIATVPDTLPPPPPTVLTPTVDHINGLISITWEAAPEAVQYRVYRSETPTAGWPGVANCTATYPCWVTMTTTAGTSWVDNGALYEQRYWYMVRALDQPCGSDPANLSAPSNAVSAILHDRIPPGPPTGINVAESDIRWTPDPDTQYSLIYCSFDDDPGDGQEPDPLLLTEIPSTTVHFDLSAYYTAPVPVDTRCWLQPMDAHGNRGALTLITPNPIALCQSSSTYTLTTPSIVEIRTRPGGTYGWTASLEWDFEDDFPRLSGFHVYRQEGNNPAQDISGLLSKQTRQFADATVKPGFIYSYTVTAILEQSCGLGAPAQAPSAHRLYKVSPMLDRCNRPWHNLTWLQHFYTPGTGTYLQWTDPYTYTVDKHVTVIVYRSLQQNGNYVAITPPMDTLANEYTDDDAEHNRYWYVVVMLDWATGEIIAQTPPWSANPVVQLNEAIPVPVSSGQMPGMAGSKGLLRLLGANLTLDIPADADTYVDSDAPATNYGSQSEMLVSYDAEVPSYRYSLAQFDLGDIPSGSIIEGASFSAYMSSTTGLSASLSVRRLTGLWDESLVVWNTRPSVDGTYATVTVTTASQWYTWNVTSLVQQWFYTPTVYPNYGLTLEGPNANHALGFTTRESGRPSRLIVAYSPPPDTLYFGVSGDNLFEVTDVLYDAGSTPWCLSGSGTVALGGSPLATYNRPVEFSCVQAGWNDGIVTGGTATVTLGSPIQVAYPNGFSYTVKSLFLDHQNAWGNVDVTLPTGNLLHHNGAPSDPISLTPADAIHQDLTFESQENWTSNCGNSTPAYYFEMDPLPLRIVPLGVLTITHQAVSLSSACTQYEERYSSTRPAYPLPDANDGYLRPVYTSTAPVSITADGAGGTFQTGEAISYTTAMPYGFEIEATGGAAFELAAGRIDNGMLFAVNLAFDYYGKPAPKTLTLNEVSVPSPNRRFSGTANHLNIGTDGHLSGQIDAGLNLSTPIIWGGGSFVVNERFYFLYIPPIQTASDRLPAEEAQADWTGDSRVQPGLNLVEDDAPFTWRHCAGLCGSSAQEITFPDGVATDLYVRRGGVSDLVEATIPPGNPVQVEFYGYTHYLKNFQVSFCDNYICDSDVQADAYLPYPSDLTIPLIDMQINPANGCVDGGKVRGDADPLTPAYWQTDIHARSVAYKPQNSCTRHMWLIGTMDIPHLAPPGSQNVAPVPLEISFNPNGTFYGIKVAYNKASYKLDGFNFLLSRIRLSNYSATSPEQPGWDADATLLDPPSSSWWQTKGFVEIQGNTLTPVFGTLREKSTNKSPRVFVLGWDNYIGFSKQTRVKRVWTALTNITWDFDLIYAQYTITSTSGGAFVGFGVSDFKVITMDRALVLNSWVQTGTVQADVLLGLSAGTGALRALAETRGMTSTTLSSSEVSTITTWASELGMASSYVNVLQQLWPRYNGLDYSQTTKAFDTWADAAGDEALPTSPIGGGTTGDLDTWGVKLKRMRGNIVWSQDTTAPYTRHFEELRISLWLDVKASGDTEPLVHADRITFYTTRDGDYVLQGKGIKSRFYQNKLKSADFIVAINPKKPTFEAGITLYELEIENIVAGKVSAVLGVGKALFYMGALVDNAHLKHAPDGMRLGGAFLFGLIDPNSEVLKNGSFGSILKDIGATGATTGHGLDSQGRLAGGYLRVYGEMPIYNYRCVFKITVGGEVAAWYFAQVGSSSGCDLYGGRLRGYIYGKVLCLVSARGDLTLQIYRKPVGGQCSDSPSMGGQFWVAGGIGFCDPEDWTTWEARWWGDSLCWTAGALVRGNYNDAVPDDWSWDYDSDCE